MNDRLSSLNLLRIFEAAGRHLSFKLAAQELNVTPSAVSHQIKTLEEELGLLLFKRLNRALSLTPAGKAYLAVVQEAFNVLRQGSQQVERRYGRPIIRFSIMPFMANEVIIPNLFEFQQSNPDVELRMEVNSADSDFALDDVDLEIRFGTGNWPGLETEKLLDVEGAPVCSSRYSSNHELLDPSDMLDKPLITLGKEPGAWRRWFDHVGLEEVEIKSSLRLENLLAHYHAVQQGLGIGIGVFPLVNPLIDSGRLVAPFTERVPIEESYFLVYRPGEKERKEINDFSAWLHRIFEQLRQQ